MRGIGTVGITNRDFLTFLLSSHKNPTITLNLNLNLNLFLLLPSHTISHLIDRTDQSLTLLNHTDRHRLITSTTNRHRQDYLEEVRLSLLKVPLRCHLILISPVSHSHQQSCLASVYFRCVLPPVRPVCYMSSATACMV